MCMQQQATDRAHEALLVAHSRHRNRLTRERMVKNWQSGLTSRYCTGALSKAHSMKAFRPSGQIRLALTASGMPPSENRFPEHR